MRAHDEVAVLLLLTAHAAAVNVEGVLHLTSRVVNIKVQRVKVKPFVFNLGAFSNVPAHGDKEVSDLFHERLQGMTGTGGTPTRGNRDIHGFLEEHAGLVLGGEDLLAGLERLGQRLARLPKVPASQTTLGGL